MRRGALVLLVLLAGCVGASGSAGTEVAGSGARTGADTALTCDPTETLLGMHCGQALCNYCEGEACPTYPQLLAQLPLCDPDDTGPPEAFPYPRCCTASRCADRELGHLDHVSCPGGFGSQDWWFEPGTGALVAHSWTTDYNCCCGGEAFGMFYGPDVRSCR